MDLYPHQLNQIVTPVRQAISGGCKRLLVVSPTGSGKTICFVYIATHAQKKGNRTWILVHRAELVEQTCRALTAWDCPHGVLAAGSDYDDSQLVQVVSVQTLASRLKKPWQGSTPDVIVVDEAHHSTSTTWLTVFRAFPSAHILGFTATPQRLDGKGLGQCFDKMIIGPEPEWLMENGYLTRPVYYGVPPSQQPDLKGIGKTGGDFSRNELALAMEAKPKLTGDVVEHYLKRAKGIQFIGFAVNLDHAGKLASAFVSAGIRCEVIHGGLSPKERAGMVARLTSGEIAGLWSVDLVAEGFDLPAVGCAILCRPTDSLGLHLQQLGRPLRRQAGKAFCVILDHVGNLRHGTAEMRREWSLDGVPRKQREKEVLDAVCQCSNCFVFLPKFTGPCPRCGFLAPVQARTLKTVKGSLKLLTAKEIDAVAEKVKTPAEIAADKLQALRRQGFARGVKNPHKYAYEMRKRQQAEETAQQVRAILSAQGLGGNYFVERRKALIGKDL